MRLHNAALRWAAAANKGGNMPVRGLLSLHFNGLATWRGFDQGVVMLHTIGASSAACGAACGDGMARRGVPQSSTPLFMIAGGREAAMEFSPISRHRTAEWNSQKRLA